MEVIIILVIAFVLLRIALPLVLVKFVNRKLSGLVNYKGRVQKININLIRGKFTLRNVRLDMYDKVKNETKPFFHSPDIVLLLNVRALFSKKVMGDIVINGGLIVLVNNIDEKKPARKLKSNSEDEFNLRESIMGLSPFDVNIELIDCELRYQENKALKNAHLELNNADVRIRNFTNIPDRAVALQTQIDGTADVYGGRLFLAMNIDVLSEYLTFDMNMKLEKVNLALLNDFLRYHAGFDVNSGTFEMYTEVVARNGEFQGYIKPLLKNLDIVGAGDKDDTLLNRIWEGFIATAYQFLKNRREDQLATKITIGGRLDNPRINILSGVVMILKNAFIKALKPSLDDVIDTKSIKDSFARSTNRVRRFFGRREKEKG